MFLSLLTITVTFFPIFALTGQEAAYFNLLRRLTNLMAPDR